jgi:hypothetical protein
LKPEVVLRFDVSRNGNGRLRTRKRSKNDNLEMVLSRKQIENGDLEKTNNITSWSGK